MIRVRKMPKTLAAVNSLYVAGGTFGRGISFILSIVFQLCPVPLRKVFEFKVGFVEMRGWQSKEFQIGGLMRRTRPLTCRLLQDPSI
jgi:hypothetical protein